MNLTAALLRLVPGAHFDTMTPDGEPIEHGCVVQTRPIRQGRYFYFDGLDSEGVECSFITAMVSRVYR